MSFECALPLAWERWVLNVHCHWLGRDEFWTFMTIGLGEMSSERALPLPLERWVLNVLCYWLGRDEFWMCIAIGLGEVSFECAWPLAWERWVLSVYCHWLGTSFVHPELTLCLWQGIKVLLIDWMSDQLCACRYQMGPRRHLRQCGLHTQEADAPGCTAGQLIKRCSGLWVGCPTERQLFLVRC